MNKITITIEEDEFGNISVNESYDGDSPELYAMGDKIMAIINEYDDHCDDLPIDTFDMRKRLKIIKP